MDPAANSAPICCATFSSPSSAAPCWAASDLNRMMTCPTPLPAKDRILLGHGSGGKLSADLLRDVFLPVFRSPVLGRLDDQAVLQIGAERLAFTTDSFVVKPLFFRGGDIGSLAVHGTINDLAMGGAEPLY